ncbi:MAG: CusA/CzcA family heavy metal efflux RND transporter [Flavobacteriales bacterium]|nr:Multidrug resistance protein MdtC [Flavobacteriales bacterium]MCC6576241.1 CusA/CzcA family heavy metal efflux RND transporter [Flavobacteriales bacterium]NUQ15555.1 CusA/CzcA family heavy metal efflux RND transporter [Flavobacteriales bacterium]
MIDAVIRFSIRNKAIVGLFTVLLIAYGGWSLTRLPIDAVPDITNNQVQVITYAPTLAAQEVEQFITAPIERSMASLPDLVEIRSVSRFGLSLITIVFEEEVDTYFGRTLVDQRLADATAQIPPGMGTPFLAPVSTGLGEIYHYALHPMKGYEGRFSPTELRTIQDWVVARQLLGTPGVAEVNSFGGQVKQYEVSIDPKRLQSMSVTLAEVFTALEKNNENTGGAYIEKRPNSYSIRGSGLLRTPEDIGQVVVKNGSNGVPLLVRDVATVGFGSAPRYGSLTRNGQGEVVGGMVLMLKDANSAEVIKAVKERIPMIQKSLPEGLMIEPYLDRSHLVDRAIGTVRTNLLEGALIVILVLVLFLGNWRAGLIVASVIPLSMLFAIILMNLFGMSGNLMSLGAIDFGLIVDGAVIIVEATLHHLHTRFQGRLLTRAQMDEEVYDSASRIRRSAAFGEIIILIVYIPILTLVGIEGKMFRPMAAVVSFAIVGALLLSLTYVPMMSALALARNTTRKRNLSDRMMDRLQRWYDPVIAFSLRHQVQVVVVAVVLFLGSLFAFTRMGGEFIPTLEEGDFAFHSILPQGASLSMSIANNEKVERILMGFPEVKQVVGRTGSAEIPTDPMPPEATDLMIILKDKDEWVTARDRESLQDTMMKALRVIPGVFFEATQPIQMRFNELMTGIRQDVAVKVYGENMDTLALLGAKVAALIRGVEGAGEPQLERVAGLPQITVNYDRARVAQYGLNIADLNRALRTAFAGEVAGSIYENERRFDLVVRMQQDQRQRIEDVANLLVAMPGGGQIALKQVAEVALVNGPAQVSRENARRRIVVGVNVRDRDVEGFMEELAQRMDDELILPTGYAYTFGGTFENLRAANARLLVAVPVALLLIFLLLFFTFHSVKRALLIYTAIPMSAIGGVAALLLRDMPFSISAGVGFIALFGVAVLNGIVLIATFDELEREGITDLKERVLKGTRIRLRPVLMTASVASLGFLPMALSGSAGAEVQRPLATVVIGGLITATALTLVVLPALYMLFMRIGRPRAPRPAIAGAATIAVLISANAHAQAPISMDTVIARALRNHPSMTAAELKVQEQEALRKSALELQPLNVQFMQGQIQGPYRSDINLQAITGVAFPTTVVRRADYLKESMRLAESEKLTTGALVKESAGGAYLQWAMGLEQVRLLEQLDSIHASMADFAARRFDVGETGRLEKTTAQSRAEQVRLQLRRAQAELLVHRAEVERWAGALENVMPVVGELLNTARAPDPGGGGDPLVRSMEQRAQVAEAEWKLQRSQWAPNLQGGGFYQTFDGVAPYSGWLIGASVPLPGSGQGARTKAARLRSEMASQELEAARRERSSERLRTQAQYEQLRENLAYYEGTGAALASTLRDDAERAYRAGEVDYFQFTQGMDEYFRISTEQLRVRYELALTVLHLRALQGL